MLLSGIFPALTTPFYPDGEVYYKKIESNVERYSRTPVAGMVVLGSTGEAILLAFYRTVADRSPLPIILYNFPGVTGYDLPAELVIELASHPNIAAIKESSG